MAHREGAFDTPFESATEKHLIDLVFLRTPAQVRLTISPLEDAELGAPYLLAAQTSAVASVFIEDSGLEALPIGGFTGTIPSPTLAQLQADIRQGRFHLVLLTSTTDPRMRWIATHCQPLHLGARTLRNYFCTPADAG